MFFAVIDPRVKDLSEAGKWGVCFVERPLCVISSILIWLRVFAALGIFIYLTKVPISVAEKLEFDRCSMKGVSWVKPFYVLIGEPGAFKILEGV